MISGVSNGVKDSDSLQSSTPLEVRLFQVVCGHPVFLEAPVLKTVFRNPDGHFPPPDPRAVALVEGPWGFAGAVDEGAKVETDPVFESDPVLFPGEP